MLSPMLLMFFLSLLPLLQTNSQFDVDVAADVDFDATATATATTTATT